MPIADKKETAASSGATDSETGQLIDLCAEQIKAALDEALREIDALSDSALDTARHASALLGAINVQNLEVNPVGESVSADCQALQQAVRKVCIRMQFADRLNQRLSNVAKNLAGLAELMKSSDLPITADKWTEFLNEARTTFTTERERKMFDTVFRASAVEIGNDSASDIFRDPTLFNGDTRDGA